MQHDIKLYQLVIVIKFKNADELFYNPQFNVIKAPSCAEMLLSETLASMPTSAQYGKSNLKSTHGTSRSHYEQE